jgi:voltage-gated potassium channel
MMIQRRRSSLHRLRRRVHLILDAGGTDFVSIFVHRALITLVVASVCSVVLSTVPDLNRDYQLIFLTVEFLAIGVFTIEYVMRVWSAPDYTPYADMHPWRARLAFMLTASALIDLISIAPFYLALFVPADLRVLILFRLLRFFKLARYSPGLRSLFAAIEAERKALLASAVVLFGLVLIAATAMHLAEHEVQPDRFGSIPQSMWWAVVTLTTVGYGDAVPVTLIGRVIAGFTMLMGLMMLALPIGIISQAFADQIHRREFVVTWGMIARVPLFASLKAHEIAEVMDYLEAQTVPANTVIIRAGETPHSMYFITSGEVEVQTARGTMRLGEGHFFGELALLNKTARRATVRSVGATKLLVLGAADLHALMQHNHTIRDHIEQVMAERS